MVNKPVIAVIDGDEVAFKIAAACETRTVKVTNTLNSHNSSFKHKTELKNFLHGLEVPEGQYTLEEQQQAGELSAALHSVKVQVESIREACKADIVEVYISGKDNFREFIPLPTQYKSKRKDTLKPILLADVRAYLVKKYSAKVVDFEEVDDFCCHRMWDGYKTKQKIIGVTTDKDACGNAGWLYNRDKMTEPEFIDNTLGSLFLDAKGKVRGVGRKWGYLQWLIGDSTDDYNPCELAKVKYGEKSAYKLLQSLETDKECIQAVYDTYKKWYPEPVSYVDWAGQPQTKGAVEIMQMYMDCYRMRRWVDDIISVKDVLVRLEIDFG